MARLEDSSHRITEFARIDLSGGSFDAFSAAHFSSCFPPHFHDTFAIGVVAQGRTMLRTPRGEWVAGPGTILAFSPGEVHSALPLTEEGYTYRMLYPSREFMSAIGVDDSQTAQGTPLFRAPVIDDPDLARQFHDAHVPLMKGKSARTVEERVVTGLRRLVELYGAGAQHDSDGRATDREVVAMAQHYMRERFEQQLRLGTVADVCGLSPFHLIRVFRRTVGVTPYAYLIQLRVNRARTMLSQGTSVCDAAYQCGFSDQSHLTRTFKKVLGVPPGQYLRSIRAA